mmetsp:Transcript_16299/g.37617  ORF Transcript_16299/g.37617 Transcript_16299/m.37617 type:complete len:199 (-) Transcript_16299:5-601(-)
MGNICCEEKISNRVVEVSTAALDPSTQHLYEADASTHDAPVIPGDLRGPTASPCAQRLKQVPVLTEAADGGKMEELGLDLGKSYAQSPYFQDQEMQEFFVQFLKEENVDLGVVITCHEKKRAVRITRVKEDGLIARWNARNPQRCVTEGCYIEEVNGAKVSAMPVSSLIDVLGKSPLVSMLVKKPIQERCASEGALQW